MTWIRATCETCLWLWQWQWLERNYCALFEKGKPFYSSVCRRHRISEFTLLSDFLATCSIRQDFCGIWLILNTQCHCLSVLLRRLGWRSVRSAVGSLGDILYAVPTHYCGSVVKFQQIGVVKITTPRARGGGKGGKWILILLSTFPCNLDRGQCTSCQQIFIDSPNFSWKSP